MTANTTVEAGAVDEQAMLEAQIPMAAAPPGLRSWELYTRNHRRWFLVVLFLVGCFNNVDRNIVSVLLEPIKAEFHVSDTMLGLLSGLSFALFYATVGIPVARWADRGDRKLVLTVSLFVWSLMTIFCGLAGSFWQLALARFGVGAGEAGSVPSGQSLLADYFPPVQRTGAIGVYIMSGSVGYALGLVLGGYIAQNYGWRAAFVIFGALSMAIAPLAHFILKEPRRDARFVRPQVVGESMLTAFRALFAKKSYRYILGAFVAYFLFSFGALVFMVSFMIRVHGMSIAQAGAAFGVTATVAALIGNTSGGVLADRLAKRNIAWLAHMCGWGLIIVTPVFLLTLASSGLIAMFALLTLSVLLINGLIPPMYSALHVVCGSRRRATALAITLFFSNLIGMGVGPVIAGAFSDGLSAHYGAADGLRYAMMIMSVFLLVSGWLMLRAARYLQVDAED